MPIEIDINYRIGPYKGLVYAGIRDVRTACVRLSLCFRGTFDTPIRYFKTKNPREKRGTYSNMTT